MRVPSRVAQVLRASGVDTVFGLMGDGNLPHLIALIDEQEICFVPTAGESGAVSMADGMARATGQIGVVSVTHGPGMTNTVTALTEAVRARSRVLLLTGDTPDVSHHLQSFDLRALAQLTGADYVRVHSAESTGKQLAGAVTRLQNEPRPIVVDIPLDIAGCADALEAPPQPLGPFAMVPDADGLDAALGIIASARKPAIIAGKGAVISGAGKAIEELAELIDAPMATTLLARGMFTDSAYDLGISGTVGSRDSIEVLAEADCLIAFGASLNRFTMADGAVAAQAPIIQIDHMQPGVDAYRPPTVAMTGDARKSAVQMRTLLREAEHTGPGWRARRCGTSHATKPGFTVASVPAAGLDLRQAAVTLNEHLPANRTVVTDTGRFIYSVWPYLDAPPGHFIHTLNFASIGLGLSAGIGASVALRDRLTVVVAGDGGLLMSLNELATAVREKLPMLIVVANDSAYGMEYFNLKQAGLDPKHALIPDPGIANIAAGYGASSVSLSTQNELDTWVRGFRSPPDGPVVLNLRLDPATVYGE